jgi:TolB-like protein/DNA-binding winged helix-turn-helix (wHTH) protein/Tfp pilus assembly protein PilF
MRVLDCEIGGLRVELDEPAAVKLRFGVFELDRREAVLRTRGGAVVPLQPQPAKVLSLLVDRAGELVTRDEIRETVWGTDTFVDFDRGLNFCIKQVRSALGDESRSPRYIETIPRQGYRFVAAVEPVDGIAARTEARTTAGRATARSRLIAVSALGAVVLAVTAAGRFVRSRTEAAGRPGPMVLAVLPFANLSGDPAQDYLAEGMTEELITQTGRLSPRSLTVIAVPTAMRYRGTTREWSQVADELGAEYVLRGTTRRSATNVYVTAALLRVRDRATMWTTSETRPAADLFTVQHEVGQHVARALAVELLPSQPAALARSGTESTAAFEAYLVGRHALRLGTEEGFEASLRAFSESSRQDPRFAPAFAGLAEAHLKLAEFSLLAPSEGCQLARPEAERALQLDPTLPEAHLRMAQAWSLCDPSSAAIGAEYRQALALNPSDGEARVGHAWFLFDRRRVVEAEQEIGVALRLDPMSPHAHSSAAYFEMSAGRPDQALERVAKALELDPDYPFGLYVLGNALSQKGHHDEALHALQRAVTASGGKPKYVFGLGMVSAQAGRRQEALGLLTRLRDLARERYVPPTYIDALSAVLRPS